MKDLEHLEWIYNRMIVVHKENPKYDYMLKFKEILQGQKHKLYSDIMNYAKKNAEQQKTDLRDELIKYEIWARETIDIDMLDPKDSINEYLKQKGE